jgi:hypothetical protein
MGRGHAGGRPRRRGRGGCGAWQRRGHERQVGACVGEGRQDVQAAACGAHWSRMGTKLRGVGGALSRWPCRGRHGGRRRRHVQKHRAVGGPRAGGRSRRRRTTPAADAAAAEVGAGSGTQLARKVVPRLGGTWSGQIRAGGGPCGSIIEPTDPGAAKSGYIPVREAPGPPARLPACIRAGEHEQGRTDACARAHE